MTLAAQITPQALPKNSGSPQQHRFTDLTGNTISLRYNPQDQMMYNVTSNKPVDFFINGTGDTISSRGYVVNSFLLKGANQQYTLDTSKVQTRGGKLWSAKDDRELDFDKNWKEYQNVKTEDDNL